jgi:uncharacterized protein
LRLGHWLLGHLFPRSALAARQPLLARVLALAAILATVTLSVLATRVALKEVFIHRVRVEISRLPSALDGTTIAQISDVHLGPTLGERWLRDLVARVNALRPDIIAVTGDLVDGSVERLRDAVAPVGELRARRGVYFVTGNHEYYWDADAWIAELRRLGVRVLRNERVTIGEDHAALDLAGIDDESARGLARAHGADLGRALKGRDPMRALVLLAHQPRGADAAAPQGVALQLSGHTHGGQFWPWKHLVRLQQRYLRGLYSLPGGTQLYVSDGTGFWGPPMRLGTRCEVALITLVARE